MARQKFRARPKGQQDIPRAKSVLERFGVPVLVVAILATGLFVYYRVFGEGVIAHDRAISDCVAEHRRASDTADMREAATALCVRIHAPPGQQTTDQ